ncbi:MAG: dihydroneopterin aldolase [Sandarakinorhabdus sp.]|nr:dihydroneopterin aldolase [Sandarakinorhabdus sp.]
MTFQPALVPKTRKIMLEDFDVPVDIGFHAFEIGTPQRLRVNIEVWLAVTHFPQCDSVDSAWDYDTLRTSVLTLLNARRFNLQETVAHMIFDLVVARPGVEAVRISTRKPDIYPDCAAVGVEMSSF